MGGHELDDPCGSRRYDAKCMDVRHDIMSSFLFLLGSDIKLLSVQILHKTTTPNAEASEVQHL